MLTLSKLRGEAATWYASDLAPHYGPNGVNCPAQVFIDAFSARFITPYLQLHARQVLDMLRQAETDAKAYSERFNAALARLASVPDLAVLSQHDLVLAVHVAASVSCTALRPL